MNVGFTAMSRDLDAPLSTIQWVATGYVLGLMATVALAEWLGSRVGLRRLLLVALGVFLVASLLCGFAPSVGSLIGFRVVAGIAGGVIPPVAHAVVVRAADGVRVGAAMSVLNGHVLAAPIFGPALGGFLVVVLDWRWLFFVSVPIAAAAMLLAWRTLPADDREPGRDIDLTGLVLLTGGLVLLVYGLAQFSHEGSWRSATIASAVGITLVVAFVPHARRLGRRAVLDISTLSHRELGVPALVVALTAATLFGSAAILPLYFEAARGETAVAAGVILAAQGLGSAVGMFVGGRIADRHGPWAVAWIGALVALLATLPWTRLDPSTSYMLLIGALVVRGAGISALLIANYTAAYTSAKREDIAGATAILSTVQRVFAAAGVALFVGLVEVQAPGVTRLEGPEGAAAVRVADAFSYTFTFVAVLAALTLLPALALPRRWKQSTKRSAENIL